MDRDRGSTLTEILIAVSLMTLLMTVLAGSVTIVLRTAPPSEVRADDARSLRGLVTWIPQDVDAAPPGGFDTAVTAWPCAGAAPVNSYNVLAISWTERTDVLYNYAATYRYEFDGSEWTILRYACDDETSPAMTVKQRHNLTSSLPPWNSVAPPASVTMCNTQVDTAGQCPAGHEITTSTSPDVRSLKLSLTRPDGTISTIDAAPKNPNEDLADDPDASSNAAPTVSQTNYVLDINAGDTVTLDLNATHSPSDADGDTLSVAIDSSEPMPPGITASTADPLDVTITADSGLASGTISTPLVLVISDPRAGWVDATITIRVAPSVNVPPTVSASTFHLQISPGETLVLPLDATHGVADANGDVLTATIINWPASRVWKPTIGAPTDPLDVQIQAKILTLLGTSTTPVEVLIEDGRGGSVSAYITVEIVLPSANHAPTVTSPDVAINMVAGETVTLSLDSSHGASDPDGDPISVEIDPSDPQPAGITTSLPGALGVTLTADASIIDGPISVPVSLEIHDGHGESVDVTITITIDPTAPPASDCMLGTLDASTSSVSRQGGGNSARLLRNDVTITVNYSGSCDGLVLRYDTGDTSGLGVGTGRVFPPGSPSSIVIYSHGNGGTEKWRPDTYTLTASTTSDVATPAITTTLTVT